MNGGTDCSCRSAEATAAAAAAAAAASASKLAVDQRAHSPERPTKIARNGDQAAKVVVEEEEEEEVEGGEKEGSEGSMSMARDRTIKNLQPSRLQRYLVAIEYVGTHFSGSQKQPSCRTVVGVLEEAFEKFIGQPVSIFCSSRTDAGVHALSNVCHVDVERISKRKPGEVLPPHEPFIVRRAVNHFLQKSAPDLMVIDVRRVLPDFHARYKAQERMYFYRLLSGAEPVSTFEKNRAWHVPEDLNLCAMQEACKILVGRHDFSSFRAAGCQANSPVRTLDELSVCESVSAPYFPSSLVTEHRNVADVVKDEKIASIPSTDGLGLLNSGLSSEFGIRRRHRCLVIKARARSFLYHQVRLLVGVLKAVGTGDLTNSDVQRILDAKNVTAASPMAPACGLYLGHVKYDSP